MATITISGIDSITGQQKQVTSSDEISKISAIILQSPNGTKYKLNIDNDGVISIAEVA